MPTHLIAASETVRTPDPHGAWLRLSAALTDQVGDLADREDLTVTCMPGAGRGAPGCFIPSLATVELDGTYLGQDPATCDPALPSDRDRYPALWGVLVHEAAHARHSRWTLAARKALPGDPAHLDAAITLEESRIEAAQIKRRPVDRRWLRSSARKLVLADFSSPVPGATGEASTVSAPMTPWSAARAAALVLARADAGVLEPNETATLARTVADVLGPSRLSALSALWHIAHGTEDDDQGAMLELGRRWCAIVGTDPRQPAPEAGEEPAEGGVPSPLAEAISKTLANVAASEAVSSGTRDMARARRARHDAREHAEETARRVFSKKPTHADKGRRGSTAITGSRPPRPDEQSAARTLARQFRAAAHRDRVTTQTTSATPPGRLRMRGALAADAQRAAGVTPTAEPFTRTTHRHVPAPPLRIGIACDVSGSMRAFARPVASAAWILARAASHVPDARAAAVIFGARVRPITYPGQVPAKVREFAARDSTEQVADAIDALDAALDLVRPGAARLLVIVSDGVFTQEQRALGQQRMTRLTHAGCAVLWLALDRFAYPLKGAHLVTLTDPATAATEIGQAAIRALRHA